MRRLCREKVATMMLAMITGGARSGKSSYAVALAQALQRILDDPDLRERFSRNARQIIAGWDNERMVMGFRRAIEYVTGQSRR